MKVQLPGPALAPKITQLKQTNRISAIVGIAMLVLVVCIAIWSLQQAASTEYWVNHTYQVINTSYQLLYDLKDAQSAARAYLLEPIAQYRSDFDAATARLNTSFASLKSLSADNPAQQARLERLAPLLARRTGRLKNLMAVRDSSGQEAAEHLREEKLGKPEADQMQTLTSQIQSEGFRLAAEREHLRRLRLTQGMTGTIGSAAMACLALFVSSFQVHRATQDLISAGEERQRSESMVNSLFEAAPEAILVVSSAGAILRTNLEIERLFGYRREELTSQPAAILVPPSFRARFERLSHDFFDDSNSGHQNQRVETTLLKKNGEEFFAAISIGRIGAGADACAVAFVSDITQRRADEARLVANAEELRSLTGKLLTAQEDERKRIARNLHDDLNQSLACLAMDLGRLADKTPLEAIPRQLTALRDRTRRSADLVRSISHQLHPAILEDLGLVPALVEFCQEFQERTGILTSIACSANLDNLSPAVSSCLYYVVGECLRNVATHAHGTSATVTLESRESGLYLAIEDDGMGFSPDRGRSGIGITAMRERLRLLGGNLAVASAQTKGTQVTATLPWS